MYQLIEKGLEISEISIFSISLLDLSLILLSERETISEILIKASKFTAPRAFSIKQTECTLSLQATTPTTTLRSMLDNNPSTIQSI